MSRQQPRGCRRWSCQPQQFDGKRRRASRRQEVFILESCRDGCREPGGESWIGVLHLPDYVGKRSFITSLQVVFDQRVGSSWVLLGDFSRQRQFQTHLLLLFRLSRGCPLQDFHGEFDIVLCRKGEHFVPQSKYFFRVHEVVVVVALYLHEFHHSSDGIHQQFAC